MDKEFDVEEGRRRVSGICVALPGAEVDSRSGQHSGFVVRDKPFAWYLVDHHGDGRVAFSCRLTIEAQRALVAAEPARFFVAPYVGRYGWIGVDLSAGEVDWREIESMAVESYRIVAPKKLAAQLR